MAATESEYDNQLAGTIDRQWLARLIGRVVGGRVKIDSSNQVRWVSSGGWLTQREIQAACEKIDITKDT